MAIFQYKNSKGKTLYGVKVYYGIDPLTKKKMETTKRGFKSKREAQAAFITMTADGPQEKVTDEITMDQLFDLWFKTYKNGVKESTAFKTEQMYKLHISNVFGKYYINQVTRPMVQSYVDELSTKLVHFKMAFNYLRRLYLYAVNLNLATDNPTLNIIVPKRTTQPRRDTSNNFYNRDELNQFLSAAKEMPEHIYIYFLLLSYTGLRRAEALALNWTDIDFKNNQISVNKTLVNGFNNTIVVAPPKTKKSDRNVPISNNLAIELRKYKLANAEFDKLFHTYLGHYMRLSQPANWLNQIYTRHPELKIITTHGFRHTFASLLFESNPNITPKDVQEMLGHETIGMSMNIYTHMTDRGKDRVLNALNEMNF